MQAQANRVAYILDVNGAPGWAGMGGAGGLAGDTGIKGGDLSGVLRGRRNMRPCRRTRAGKNGGGSSKPSKKDVFMMSSRESYKNKQSLTNFMRKVLN